MNNFLTIIKYIVKLALSLIDEFFLTLRGFIHYSKLISTNSNRAYLTRNIHRIEKGLIMKDVRKNFGKSYIIETLKFHKKYLEVYGEDLEYETSILKYYVENYVDDKNILEASTYLKKKRINFNKLPYDFFNIEHGISFDNFKKLSKQRVSVRWFNNKKVDLSILENALKCGLESPSACNRQPFRYDIIYNKDLIKKIGNIPGGMRGYIDNVNCLLVCIGDLSSFQKPTDRHLIYIDASLANMSLILALETQGISSCCINWQDIPSNNSKASKILNLKNFEKIIMMIGVGYPKKIQKIPFSSKKKVSSLLNIIE